MNHSSKYFCNRDCEYFPCHKIAPGSDFNCLFCYCPMNSYEDCLGSPSYIERANGKVIKNCTGCSFPHDPANYDAIMAFLKTKLS